jgi:hypothetical protein
MHANMPQKIAKYDTKKAKYDLICYEKIFAKIKKKSVLYFNHVIYLHMRVQLIHYLIS